MKAKLNDEYLHNDYFYLTCSCCDRLIKVSEMTETDYNENNGYCAECSHKINTGAI